MSAWFAFSNVPPISRNLAIPIPNTDLVATKELGEYTEEIDGSTLPSGVYLYRISIGRLTATKSLTVIH